MKTIYWGECMAQTDIGGLWCEAKVRPLWYWTLCRLRLFWAIASPWRHTQPLDWRTAWEVSAIAVGLVGPVPVSSAAEVEAQR